MITEDDLRAAATTISRMSDAELDRRLNRLKEARSSRNAHAEIRDRSELDSAELDQAAYQLACQHHRDGDLTAAARWYLVAATNDFGDASLQLGKVLDALAGGYLGRAASRVSTREEMDLVSESARWYAAAYAAGHTEAAELLDALIAHHDPSRPRATRAATEDPADEPEHSNPICPMGGLQTVVTTQELTSATSHFRDCPACQQELLAHGGLLPTVRKHPTLELPPTTPRRDSGRSVEQRPANSTERCEMLSASR